MKVSLASTSEYAVKAAESISDLSPNAADVLITSVVTAMVTELGVCSPTSAGLLTFHDGEQNILIFDMAPSRAATSASFNYSRSITSSKIA